MNGVNGVNGVNGFPPKDCGNDRTRNFQLVICNFQLATLTNLKYLFLMPLSRDHKYDVLFFGTDDMLAGKASKGR